MVTGCDGVMEVDLTEVSRNWLYEHHPQGIPYRICYKLENKARAG